jgi:hypothetical protein
MANNTRNCPLNARPFIHLRARSDFPQTLLQVVPGRVYDAGAALPDQHPRGNAFPVRGPSWINSADAIRRFLNLRISNFRTSA